VRQIALVAVLCAAAGAWAACRAPEPRGDRTGAEAAPKPALPEAAEARPPRLLDLGDHHHAITTNSEQAQRYFDQGLVLTYGFNHEAAIDSFREAARLDPECAMCFWGVALAYGPNINAPMGPEASREALRAIRRARSLAAKVGEDERAYIEALATRYSEDPAADRAALDHAYADAMRKLHHRDPDDLDAATLFAESLMDLGPWDYWTESGEPREHTEEMVRTLESVLARNPDHPGANHYLIHALEEFEPERAEAAADRLAGLAPDAGHLVHMPSHIYWRVGRYEDAVNINEAAAAADVAYFAWCRSPRFYAAGYYNHNLHFIWAAASSEGRSDLALTAARRLVANIPEEEVPNYPFLEDYLAVPILTLARFGRWDEILGEPKPSESLRYATGAWHYARGLAYTRRGEFEKAEAERESLEVLASDPEMAALVFDVAGGTAAERLQVGLHHLIGEMAAARGDSVAAVAALEESVAAQDAMNYIEPPAWYFPVRQALGAVLLEAGRPGEADAIYRADLDQYPRNGWSLFGLAQALRAQGMEAEAAWAQSGFANAWARADVTLTASRF
jgi:tetratricopeptide (TPR) repeat protein